MVGEEKPRETVEKEIELYLDAYKHHFDLFIKGALIYFAAIATVAGYMFREGMNDFTRYAMAFFITAFSVITAFGCATSLRWLEQVRCRVHELNGMIGMTMFPFDGAKWVGRLVFAAAVVFFVAGVAAFVGIRMGKL